MNPVLPCPHCGQLVQLSAPALPPRPIPRPDPEPEPLLPEPAGSYRTLATIEGVQVRQYENGVVQYTANAAIDADGSNGQHGLKPAYNDTDSGSDYLANGGMAIRDGEVVGTTDWWDDIAISENGKPMVLPDGTVPSMTAYKEPGMDSKDPEAYVDSEFFPYAVVPPSVRMNAAGVVLGAHCRMEYNGRSIEGPVADIGPGSKIGEMSIAAARELGINSSPRNGGTSSNSITYTIWPDVPGQANGREFKLLPA